MFSCHFYIEDTSCGSDKPDIILSHHEEEETTAEDKLGESVTRTEDTLCLMSSCELCAYWHLSRCVRKNMNLVYLVPNNVLGLVILLSKETNI